MGQEKTFGQTVFGNVADAQIDSVGNALHDNFLAIHINLAFGQLFQTKQSTGQFASAGAKQTGDAQNFAGIQFEGDALEQGLDADVVYLHQAVAGNVGLFKVSFLDLTAGHVVDELFAVKVGHSTFDNLFAAAQNGQFFANFKNFFQLVRYKDNADALGLQVADYLEQGVNFLLGQSSGRFVHNQQLGILQQSAADGNQLFIGNGQVANQGVQVHFYINHVQSLLGLFTDRFPVYKFLAIHSFRGHGNIFSNSQVRENGKILIDNLDTFINGLLRGHFAVGFSTNFNRTAIGSIVTRNDLDQGRFAAAVFAGQTASLTLHDLHVDVFQGLYATKGLTDTRKLHEYLGHIIFSSPTP